MAQRAKDLALSLSLARESAAGTVKKKKKKKALATSAQILRLFHQLVTSSILFSFSA